MRSGNRNDRDRVKKTFNVHDSVEEFWQGLLETAKLAKRFEWNETYFEIDNFDFVINDLVNIAADENIPFDKASYLYLLSKGIERHTTIDTRYRILKRIKELLKSHVDSASRKMLSHAMIAVENTALPPSWIGLLLELYSRALNAELLKRSERTLREKKMIDLPELRQVKEKIYNAIEMMEPAKAIKIANAILAIEPQYKLANLVLEDAVKIVPPRGPVLA